MYLQTTDNINVKNYFERSRYSSAASGVLEKFGKNKQKSGDMLGHYRLGRNIELVGVATPRRDVLVWPKLGLCRTEIEQVKSRAGSRVSESGGLYGDAAHPGARLAAGYCAHCLSVQLPVFGQIFDYDFRHCQLLRCHFCLYRTTANPCNL